VLDSSAALRVGLFAAAGVALAVAATAVREKHALANATVEEIERQLDALDPATRAAVIARLSAHAAKTVHQMRTGS